MRILMVTNGFPPVAHAGVESHSYALARELHLAGLSVHVFCRDEDLTMPMYTVRDTVVDGIPVTRVVNNFLDVYEFEQFYENPRIEVIYAQLLEHYQPDIIHIQHCIGLSLGVLRQSIASGTPTIVTLHDYWYICPTVNLMRPDTSLCAGAHHGMNCFDCVRMFPRPVPPPNIPFYPQLQKIVPTAIRRRASQFLSSIQEQQPTVEIVKETTEPIIVEERVNQMRTLLADATLILTPSHHLKNKYIEFGIIPGKMRVVPLGMNVSQWLEVSRPARSVGAPLRFGYAGSFLPMKGADIAVRAFKKVQGNMTLELIGFESMSSSYPALLKDLAVDDPRITYVGSLSNRALAERFAYWDALLMPALWEETFSFVAREALLTGLPVIASDMPVLPEIIESGKNGFLLPPGDVSAWAAQFQTLLDNPTQLLSLNPRADTSFARTFVDHATEQITIYRELLSGNQPSFSGV